MSDMGLIVDAQRYANHYFEELVIINRTGHQPAIGQTKNEFAIIVGRGNMNNGGWLCTKIEHPDRRPVERNNVRSITIRSNDDDLTKMDPG
jgi:hypothetical protein